MPKYLIHNPTASLVHIPGTSLFVRPRSNLQLDVQPMVLATSEMQTLLQKGQLRMRMVIETPLISDHIEIPVVDMLGTGSSDEIANLRAVVGDGLGSTATDLNGLLLNLGNYFPFNDLPDGTPSVVEALNTLNEQIGNRNFTGPVLTDGQTVTASLQALANAISGSSATRVIERLTADIPAGTPHTLPGGNTYTTDGGGNGRYLWVFWRGVLRDPGAVTGGNDYDETSTTQITPHTKLKSGDHINYMIFA